MSVYSAIPTDYAGTRFRSRLEARWACLFDLIGWRWEYEPFDLAGYIPDFLILGAREILVEIKPWATLTELAHVADRLPAVDRDLLVVGCTPLPDDDIYDGLMHWYVGMMREHDPDHNPGNTISSPCQWHRCTHENCRQIACHHTEQCFVSRPCGHYDGDHYLGLINPQDISAHWAEARNRTQWKAA